MKKLFFILISIFILTQCFCSDDDSTKKIPGKFITGIAAIGAYMPNDSPVELRGKSKESTPSKISKSTVKGDKGEYAINVEDIESPYLIRIQDKNTNKWFYSYVNDGTRANINPYTDALIRQWYLGKMGIENPGNLNIDDSFTNGIFTIQQSGINFPIEWYNIPINMPNDADIEKVRIAQSYSVFERYNVLLENVFTQDWKIGESYDSLLENAKFEKSYFDRIAFEMFYHISFIEKADVYYNDLTGRIYAKLYTKFGEPNGIEFKTDDSGCSMIYQSIDEKGVRYFTCDIAFTIKQSIISFEIIDASVIPAARIIGFPTYTK